MITAPRDESAAVILDALEIASPRAVILLFGGAAGLDESRKGHLATLFADGVTPVAAELGALIIDGGTQSEVMAMMGEAVARHPGTCQLLGIAAKGKSYICNTVQASMSGHSREHLENVGFILAGSRLF